MTHEQIYIDVTCNDDRTERKVSYFRCGSKTESGKDRIIPIHEHIKPYVIYYLEREPTRQQKNVFLCGYHHFCDLFKEKLIQLELNEHTLHDTRVTFTTLCQPNNVDAFSRKRILGHKMKNITFDTYTDTVIYKLYQEVNKIKI